MLDHAEAMEAYMTFAQVLEVAIRPGYQWRRTIPHPQISQSFDRSMNCIRISGERRRIVLLKFLVWPVVVGGGSFQA
jgi:hypothetical protein